MVEWIKIEIKDKGKRKGGRERIPGTWMAVAAAEDSGDLQGRREGKAIRQFLQVNL